MTVPCEARVRGFFGRADSIVYISRQGMTSLDLCLQLIPPAAGTSWPGLAPQLSDRSWRPLTPDGAARNGLYLISCQLRLIHSRSIDIWVKRTRMEIMQKSVTFFSTLEFHCTNFKTVQIKSKIIQCTIFSIRVIVC